MLLHCPHEQLAAATLSTVQINSSLVIVICCVGDVTVCFNVLLLVCVSVLNDWRIPQTPSEVGSAEQTFWEWSVPQSLKLDSAVTVENPGSGQVTYI